MYKLISLFSLKNNVSMFKCALHYDMWPRLLKKMWKSLGHHTSSIIVSHYPWSCHMCKKALNSINCNKRCISTINKFVIFLFFLEQVFSCQVERKSTFRRNMELIRKPLPLVLSTLSLSSSSSRSSRDWAQSGSTPSWSHVHPLHIPLPMHTVDGYVLLNLLNLH